MGSHTVHAAQLRSLSSLHGDLSYVAPSTHHHVQLPQSRCEPFEHGAISNLVLIGSCIQHGGSQVLHWLSAVPVVQISRNSVSEQEGGL